MEYNTSQTKLVNGEYGRHIQKMIEYAIEINDRDLRNQQAKAIVRAMSCFSAGSKDTDDYWNKLWDQLFVISNYRLDVDSPFPKPQLEIENRPKPLKYPKRDIRYRPYGVVIEDVINKVITEEDSAEKEQTVENIANHLKRQYLNWNRDSVNDTLIHEHLDTLSQGKLKLQENFNLCSTRIILDDLAAEKIINAPKSANKKKKNNDNIDVSNTNNSNNKNNNRNKKKNNQQHNPPRHNQMKPNHPKLVNQSNLNQP
jgi:hypothetical protein